MFSSSCFLKTQSLRKKKTTIFIILESKCFIKKIKRQNNPAFPRLFRLRSQFLLLNLQRVRCSSFPPVISHIPPETLLISEQLQVSDFSALRSVRSHTDLRVPKAA